MMAFEAVINIVLLQIMSLRGFGETRQPLLYSSISSFYLAASYIRQPGVADELATGCQILTITWLAEERRCQ
jgi:hypothetical protein